MQILNLDISGDRNIYFGDSNEQHMKSKHPKDYEKYGSQIEAILATPDYVGINASNNSIEYVKEFKIDNEFVKIAVRVTTHNKYYARTLYVLNNNRVNNFIQKGTLKPV